MTARRFPPPWSIAEYNDACFIVRDRNGQALAYAYCEEEPARRDEARRACRALFDPLPDERMNCLFAA